MQKSGEHSEGLSRLTPSYSTWTDEVEATPRARFGRFSTSWATATVTEWISAYYGRSDRAFWLDFVAKHKPRQSLEELLALKQNRLIDILRRDQPLFDGLPDLLERLAPRYALAVASGSNHPVIEEVLAMRQLGRFFSVVVSVQDVPRGKPAPDVFLRAAQMLAVPAARCCVVEDSAHGVEAARAAGMEVIAITNTLPSERLAAASHVVETYEEIESLLLEPVRDP